jgi:hypothetical protein
VGEKGDRKEEEKNKTKGGRSQDSAVVTASSYGLKDGGVGVRVSVGSRIFSSPRGSDRIWGPSNGYRGVFYGV